jgi:hypothetical protein
MATRRIIWHVLLAIGLCTTLAGGLFASLYVVEAVFARLGEADQSMLFWALPILFLGLLVSLTGLILTALAWRRLHAGPTVSSRTQS